MSRQNQDRDQLHGDQAAMAALLGNGCRGKVRHPSKHHALAVGRNTVANGYQRAGLVLNAYKCGCGSWHLGHSPRRYLTPDVMVRSTATEMERALAKALRPYIAS